MQKKEDLIKTLEKAERTLCGLVSCNPQHKPSMLALQAHAQAVLALLVLLEKGQNYARHEP